jgi:hypothetical protein
MPFHPLDLLRNAIKKVPAMKYAFGVIALAATIAIIEGLDINNAEIPVVTFLLVFGFLILIFIFSVLVSCSAFSEAVTC